MTAQAEERVFAFADRQHARDAEPATQHTMTAASLRVHVWR